MDFTALRITKFLTLTCKTFHNPSLSYFFGPLSASALPRPSSHNILDTLVFYFVLGHTEFIPASASCRFLFCWSINFLPWLFHHSGLAQISRLRRDFPGPRDPNLKKCRWPITIICFVLLETRHHLRSSFLLNYLILSLFKENVNNQRAGM